MVLDLMFMSGIGSRNKISVIIYIYIYIYIYRYLDFRYISEISINIGEYFDKNIGKMKINKKYFEIYENTLSNYKKDINEQVYTC